MSVDTAHPQAATAIIHARVSNPEVRRPYEAALTAGQRIAGPAPPKPCSRGETSEEAVHWLQANFLKTELEFGPHLRLPAEGPCDGDLALTYPKVPDHQRVPPTPIPLDREDQLVADAQQPGWQREMGLLHDQVTFTITRGPGVEKVPGTDATT